MDEVGTNTRIAMGTRTGLEGGIDWDERAKDKNEVGINTKIVIKTRSGQGRDRKEWGTERRGDM